MTRRIKAAMIVALMAGAALVEGHVFLAVTLGLSAVVVAL